MNPKDKNRSPWLIRLVLVLGAIFLVLIACALYKETEKKKKVQDEINKLKEEAVFIEKQNMKLSERINYLESKDFQEKEAKDKLNLQNPDENVVVIKPGIVKEKEAEIQQDNTEKKVIIKESNFEKWWRYFFSN